jgi:hypothetical protein
MLRQPDDSTVTYKHLGLLGMKRFPTDDTICNLFRRFGIGEVQRFFEPMIEWQMQRLPLRPEGYTLEMDSDLFERYGKQEGSLKGHNRAIAGFE